MKFYFVSALPVALANVKGYNPETRLLYGLDSRGLGYMEIDLNKYPLKVSQIDESLWTAKQSQPELIQSKLLPQSILGDSLTTIPNTSEYSCKYILFEILQYVSSEVFHFLS